MIQITLQFASIEAARAALLEIPTSVLVGAQPKAPGLALESGEFVPAAEVNKAAKVAAPKPAATPAAAAPAQAVAALVTPATESPSDPKPPAAAPVAEASAVSTAAPSATPSTSVDYPTLQKAVFTLAGKSREAAAAVAASFGVKTFKELDSAKWGEALAAVNAKIAEL